MMITKGTSSIANKVKIKNKTNESKTMFSLYELYLHQRASD